MQRTARYALALSVLIPAAAGCTADVAPDDLDAEIAEIGESEEAIEVGYDDLAPSVVRDAVVLISGCTGTLVAPNLVLTAAHCGFLDFAYADGGWHVLPSPVSVEVGKQPGHADNFETTATQVSVPPLATEGPWPHDDIALLKLATSVPAAKAKPRPIYLDRPATLSSTATIFQVGYGGVHTYRRIMTGDNYQDWISDPAMLMNGFDYEATVAGPGIGDRDTNIEGGDSGGPMLLGNDTSPVMGVLSHWAPYGIATFGPGGEGRPSVKGWLATHVPQKPDFSVVSIVAAGCTGSGGNPVVRVRVKQGGTVRSRAWVDVFNGLAAAPTIGTYSSLFRMTGWINPEGTEDLYFEIAAPPGGRWIDVLLDTTQTVPEQNETNNVGSAFVTLADCSFG